MSATTNHPDRNAAGERKDVLTAGPELTERIVTDSPLSQLLESLIPRNVRRPGGSSGKGAVDETKAPGTKGSPSWRPKGANSAVALAAFESLHEAVQLLLTRGESPLLQRSYVVEDRDTRRTDRLLSLVLGAVSHPVVVVSSAGTIIGANAAFEAVALNARADVPLAQLEPKDAGTLLLDLTRRAVESSQVEPVWRRLRGREHLVRARSVVDVDGACRGVIFALEPFDVGQLVQRIVCKLGMAIFVWDNSPGWPTVVADGRIQQLFGYSPEELLSGRVRYDELIHPLDKPRVFEEVRVASEDPSVDQFHLEPYRIITKDGNVRWVDNQTDIVRDEQGRVAFYEGLVSSADERMEDGERLRDLADVYHTAMQVSKTTVWSISAQLDIQWIEGPLVKDLGYEQTSRFDWDEWLARVHPDDREGVIAFAAALSHGGDKARGFQVRMFDADGRKRWLFVEARVRQDAGGHVVDYLGLVHDTTDRHAALETNYEATRVDALERMAVGIAHGFNNLLTVMRSNVEFLLDDAPRRSTTRADLLEVRDAVASASELTTALLEYGRRQRTNMAAVGLNDIVRSARDMRAPSLSMDVAIECSLEPDVGLVAANPVQLKEAIWALIGNAEESYRDGGSVRIGTSNVPPDIPEVADWPRGEYVYLVVSDDGVGMDSVTCERATEPYFSTKKADGAGLGLSMVRAFVKQAGGRLGIHSRVGHGTTVVLALPRSDARPLSSKPSPGDDVALDGKKVLLVDDQAVVRLVTRRMIEAMGCEVIEAESARDALDVLETEDGAQVDLLVTDVVMPGMSGMQLAKLVRDAHPGIAVAYVSAGGFEDEIQRMDPGTAYLSKPFKSAELAKAMRKALRRA